MSEIVPRKDAIQTIGDYLLSPQCKSQIALALPRGMSADRMTRIVLSEIRRTPKLAECDFASLMGATMQCAQLGLEPGPMGLAWLIPYGKQCQFQLGYKGLLALIWRSEMVSSIQAEVVYEGDSFDYSYGIPPNLHHKPAPERSADAKPTHCYAIIGTKSDGWIFRVMTFSEIEMHREKFVKSKSGPWQTDWDEMACKTLLVRTGKRAPINAEAQTAIALDTQADLGIPQNFEIDVTPPEPDADQPDAPEKPKPKKREGKTLDADAQRMIRSKCQQRAKKLGLPTDGWQTLLGEVLTTLGADTEAEVFAADLEALIAVIENYELPASNG